MVESILLENVFEKRHINCNRDMLVVDSSNTVLAGDNNLLSNLKSRWLSEARSFITRV